MKLLSLFICPFLLNLSFLTANDSVIKKNIEGWNIHVDSSLISGKHKELGEKVLESLKHRLYQIKTVMRKDRIKELQTIEIRLEYQNSKLNGMQYHPSRRWLLKNGHDPALEKKVHIPVAKRLVDKGQIFKHPWVILHELAHGYHHQILSFDDKRIIEAYERALKNDTFKNVLNHNCRHTNHYANSDHKEFFAEFTETYFGMNDFYPFVHAELKKADPKTFKLMQDIWGKR